MRRNGALHVVLACVLPCVAYAAEGPSHGYMTASDGLKIHYMAQGKGVPVVLIHGYAGSAEGNWFRNGIADALSKNHYVVALDVRGHGESDKPAEWDNYRDQMFMDVVELMDHLNIDKAHVHGYSMGGEILSHLLARYPERFITAIYGGSGILETDEKYIAATPKDKVGPDPEEAEAMKKAKGKERSPEERKSLLALGITFVRRPPATLDLTKIKIPVLVMNGEFDSPIARSHRMERELEDVKKVVLPGKSHLTAIMAGYMPQQYLDTLVAFINANDPK